MSRDESGKAFDIVATGPIDPAAVAILAPYGNLVIAADGNEASLLPLMGPAVGLVVRGGGVATKAMISAAPHLRVIGRPGAGYDSVDVSAAGERKIPVVYVPGVGARAVAEAALTLILALAKDLPYLGLPAEGRGLAKPLPVEPEGHCRVGDWACGSWEHRVHTSGTPSRV